MAAVQHGDMDEVQRMVDVAAKAAGYGRAGRWYVNTLPIRAESRGKQYHKYPLGVVRGSGIPQITIGEYNAVVVENWPSGRDYQQYLLGKLADTLYEKFSPKKDYFIRATNNKDEIVIAKRGELRPSQNHRDHFIESGLSVADHYGYAESGSYLYAYKVKGRIVSSRGTDGEMLLDPKTVEVVGDLLDRAGIARAVAQEEKSLASNLRESEWDESAFTALASGLASRIQIQENLKSAKPVIYDGTGNVIPLSERFDVPNVDIWLHSPINRAWNQPKKKDRGIER